MWKASDVDASKKYRLALVQAPNGGRRFFLEEEGTSGSHKGTTFYTAHVPNELLIRGDIGDIARQVPLKDGQPFFVDAHNVWITQEEMSALSEDKEDEEIPWLNGMPPMFAPK